MPLGRLPLKLKRTGTTPPLPVHAPLRTNAVLPDDPALITAWGGTAHSFASELSTALATIVPAPLPARAPSPPRPAVPARPPKVLTNDDLGERIGGGAEKWVYRLRDYPHHVVCVPRHDAPLTATPERLRQEVDLLKQLADMEVPTVGTLGLVQVGDETGILKRFVPGARDHMDVQVAANLTAASLVDIDTIKEALRKNDVGIVDMDLLVGDDGRVYVDDPYLLKPGLDPLNIAALDRLAKKLNK